MAANGWYGPLIDLSSAHSHIADYVQLLVFVHRSTPVEYKVSKRGSVIRTDLHVGDDTRPFFSVSIWDKRMCELASAGDIILLQNARLTTFRGVIGARTVLCSSILTLVQPYKSVLMKDVDELVYSCRVGKTVKEKLRKVITWVQKTRPTLRDELLGCQQKKQTPRNWKVHKEQTPQDCYMLSEVLRLTSSSKAIFHASVGEIFLPLSNCETDKERMFISCRLMNAKYGSVIEDFICNGCQICGSLLGSKSPLEKDSGPSYCRKSSNRLHNVGLIYRPFMLYVWDDSEYISLLVRNKAAEILFGGIKADQVYQSFREPKHGSPKAPDRDSRQACSAVLDRGLKFNVEVSCSDRSLKFHIIWFTLLRILMHRRENSPLKFTVSLNTDLEVEDGRFEMISMSMPCVHNTAVSKSKE